MRKINISNEKIVLEDDEIFEIFEKKVTPHGTGGKIPCSSKLIGKKVYVIVRK
jgi:putative transposon-encoded protein